MKQEPIIFEPRPAQPPPERPGGVKYWLRKNLFSNWVDSVLTVVCLTLILLLLPEFIQWAFINATWTGDSAHCTANPEGACWAFIASKFRVLMVGVYPRDQDWRIIVGAIVLGILVVLTVRDKLKGRYLLACWFVLPFFGYWMIGGGAGLENVDQSRWGGLTLSLLLAIVGIIISIPFGILLALGRFSGPPIVAALSVGMIETVRGVPLITILFMASVMMPLFLPPGFILDNMFRIQVGIILFSSAYIAEVVRGGLQALPKGQFEAASSLGLGYMKTMGLIVLPQALRHVLPPLIGRCIALFKDTSLVIIVGLLDFLGMIKSSSLDAEWLGFNAEAYVFGAFVYWIICYSLSKYGALLEKRNSTSH